MSRHLTSRFSTLEKMSPFLVAIFLLGLCLANAVNFTTVYEWERDTFDFVWPSGADSSTGQIKDKYSPENVYPKYMAVFGQRLFLSLNMESGIPATLVWLPTSIKSTAPPKLAPFPSWHLHEKDNCENIKEAKGMETDTDGRLWVLDEGSRNCPGKIWIFNLVNNDTIERVHHFPDSVVSHSYDKRWLHDIVLDKTQDDYLAYITDSRSERIVIYSRITDKSWTAITPVAGRKWISLALSPNKEARQLYLGRYDSKELYSVSVSELKNEGGSAAVKFIGEWNGNPYRMLIDSSNVFDFTR
ncbi:protein yellow-like [Cloeon dipterum]|uniref:protein yellow-like n=1 Tax=Cloeon dipterum TaxID=197152 RepID=UPI00322039A3